MKDNNQILLNSFKVSYYFSYKEWSNQLWLQGWPGYASLIIAGLFGWLVRPSDIVIICLLVFSLFVLLGCVFITRFYANSILEITETGLKIVKRGREKHFRWSEIERVVFMTPAHGASYREIVIGVFNKSNKIDYIIIESLYFKKANEKAKEIGYLIEMYLDGYTFKIHQSTFYAPIMLKERYMLPTIYPARSGMDA